MTPEEILKTWKHNAPKGATHFLIIEGRDDIGWFVGKDFYMACRGRGVVNFRYDKGGVDYLRQSGELKGRKQTFIPLKPISLENK